MDVETLRQEYESAKKSDRFAVHKQFTNDLLSSNDEDVIRYHYSLLSDRENPALYQRVRAAFAQRGEPGQQFLVARAREEKDPALRADILLLLGTMRHPAALELARKLITSDDPEMRRRACYVLGWMGQPEDIDLLEKRLLEDPDPDVRRTAAVALRQVWFRLPDQKNRLLKVLKRALETEKDEHVVTGIILAVQAIMEKRFGLREDIEERKVTGDVQAAKEKCLRALARLPL